MTARLGVTARLERAATGELVWTERFQLRATELHSLENVIAERVVVALDLRIAAEEQDRLRRRYTGNVAAYEDYLRGRALLVRYTPEATLGAIAAFQSAIDRDPAHALARAGLAMACADMCLRFARPPDVDWLGTARRGGGAGGARARLQSSPRLTWRAPRSRASASSTGTRSSSRAGARWRSTGASIRPTSSSLPRTGTLATWRRRGLRWRAGKRLKGARCARAIPAAGSLIALWSGRFAPARVHFEEVSRLSKSARELRIPTWRSPILLRQRRAGPGPCLERWPPHRPHRRPRAPAH